MSVRVVGLGAVITLWRDLLPGLLGPRAAEFGLVGELVPGDSLAARARTFHFSDFGAVSMAAEIRLALSATACAAGDSSRSWAKVRTLAMFISTVRKKPQSAVSGRTKRLMSIAGEV
jgi:hypothetical protein